MVSLTTMVVNEDDVISTLYQPNPRKFESDFRQYSDEIQVNLGLISGVGRLLVVGDMNQRFRAVATSHAVVDVNGDTMKGVGFSGFEKLEDSGSVGLGLA